MRSEPAADAGYLRRGPHGFLFPNQAWVETLITNDMNVSRRPLAHMNPLSVDDVTNVEVAFRKWVKQLRAAENLIP